MEKVDLVAPVEKAVKMLSKMGLEFFDVYAAYSRGLSIEILGKGIKESMSRTDLGLGVRAYKNKGLGVAFSQSLKAEDIETTVRRLPPSQRSRSPTPTLGGCLGLRKQPRLRVSATLRLLP